MKRRNLIWMAVAVALSAGILWMPAQENKDKPEGVKIGEMAEMLKEREKAVAVKEASLSKLEQRLNTFQATLLQEQERLNPIEKSLEAEKAKLEAVKSKLEADHKRELDRMSDLDKKREVEKAGEAKKIAELEKAREELAREIERLKEESAKAKAVVSVSEQLVRTYEAMTPVAAATALKELAQTNMDVAILLTASMTPKKAARVLDQLVPLDAKMAGDISEKLGLQKKEGAR